MNFHIRNYIYPGLISLTLIAIFLGFYQKTFYNQLLVTLEMKCDTICQVHLFHSENKEFQQPGMLMNLYNTVDEFQPVSFHLPMSGFRSVRIDPAVDSVQFSLRQVVFKSGPDSLIIRGNEILSRFRLISLTPIDSLCTNQIVVLKSNSIDPNLIFKGDIRKSISLVNINKTRNFRIGLFIVCSLIGFLLIFKRKFITNRWNLILHNLDHTIRRAFQHRNRTFVFWILGLILFKYFLISAQPMNFITYATHDDEWFINKAYSLANGHWLEEYSAFTFLRGVGYPIFIAVSNFLGLSLPLAQYLLLVISALVFIYAVLPLVKSKVWLTVLFAIILFNPMNSVQPLTRVLREGIYTSLGVLVFGAFIGMLVHRDRSKGSLARWSLLSSAVLLFFWNTREEGIIIIPSLLLFAASGIILVFRENAAKPEKPNIPVVRSIRIKRAFLFMAPFFILIAGNTILGTFNYFYYGKFIVNELKSGSFPKANIALTNIADHENKLMVPVTRKMMKQAFEVSPSFRQLKGILDDKNNQFMKFGPGFPDEYEGGWFYFAFRAAASQAGYHQSLTISQDYYQSIADEINQAFREERLKKKNQLSLFSFTWDQRYTRPFLRKLKEGASYAIRFSGYSPYPHFNQSSPEQIARFQNMTLTYSSLTPEPEGSLTMANSLKYSLLKTIARYTHKVSYPAFILSVTGFFILSLLMLFSRRKIEDWVPWAVLAGLLMLIIARVALVAYLAVTQFDAIGPHYLNFVYPFLLIFTFLGIFFPSGMIYVLISQKRKTKI